MRIAYALGLLAGLALLGFGCWLLYARLVAGPDYYWGKPDDAAVRERAEALAQAERGFAEQTASTARLRATAEALPPEADPDTRARAARIIETADRHQKQGEAMLARARERQAAAAEQYEADVAEAGGRTLRRGVLFALVGAVWSIRAAGALRRSPAGSEVENQQPGR